MSNFNRRNFLKISGITALGTSIFPFWNIRKANQKSLSGEKLYEVFKNPGNEHRSFVRWWWNGNRVEKEEILRQLDILKEAGIGGVEINPIAMPSEVPEGDKEPLTWLSPEWNEMVDFTIREASKRDIKSDMIVGAGWPFGGEFLPIEDQMKGIVLQKIEMDGPQTFRGHLEQIVKKRNNPNENADDKKQEALKPELLFIRLAPAKMGSLSECVDMQGEVEPDGSFTFKVPEGNHILYIGTIQTGVTFREVTLAAPGVEGPCLDHYNRSAVMRYLNRVSDRLGPLLGGKLGNGLRALFVDSIELSGSNWTQDLPEQFRKRRGYELEPYYPFVFYENSYAGYKDSISFTDDVEDTIKRVRYDYNHTLVELFLERFIQTFQDWCESQNVLSRYQAYGLPWLMGLAEGYMIPDIPESNNWLFHQDPYYQGCNVWSKYASSGAHLTGKNVVSSEAMTNTRGIFKADLEIIKQADDLNFIMGINHSVLHGFNYSPKEAGFPGWIRFGAYFSEQNTWWPYFPKWVDYNGRLSAVFQNSEPVVDIAILTPRADRWSETGLARVQIQTDPWYGTHLWESIHQNGASADYIQEKTIQDAKKDEGTLEYGPMAYHTLILTDVVTMAPKTARSIEEFVRSGGRVIFIGNRPSRSPSLLHAAEDDAVVKKTIQNLTKDYPEQVQSFTAPDPEQDLHIWMNEVFEQVSMKRSVTISDPDPAVYQIFHKMGEKEIFFFANTDEVDSKRFNAKFRIQNKTPWRWDPGTGERSIYPHRDSKNHLEINLDPLESLLLVFDEEQTGPRMQQIELDTSSAVEVDGPWDCEFHHADGSSFSRNVSDLEDFSHSTDNRLKYFAGTIQYRNTFSLDKVQSLMLDLGEIQGVSEVTVNGQPVGINWWGNHRFDISEAVQTGNNTLEVSLTTVLYNYVKLLADKGNPTARKWIQSQNETYYRISRMTQSQDLVSTGMKGPVCILKKIDN